LARSFAWRFWTLSGSALPKNVMMLPPQFEPEFHANQVGLHVVDTEEPRLATVEIERPHLPEPISLARPERAFAAGNLHAASLRAVSG
jgi:hypothetical protein